MNLPCRMVTGLGLALIPGIALAATANYVQTNLTSDLPGVANITDPNLVNPWGIAFSTGSPFWIADNGTGLATVYNGAGQPFPVATPLVVTVPVPGGGTPPSAPTGAVFNTSTGFQLPGGNPATFLFSTEDGTISGWNSGSSAVLEVDNSASGAVYKGLTLDSNASGTFLYASNFNAGTIDVFNSSFAPATLSGSFTDPNLPKGFAPFNIQNIGGALYVTYAKQDTDKHDDVPGSGNGFVDVYDANGKLTERLISNGVLNSPWGLTLAPASFGAFGGDLLVGNFGDGSINAFNATTGAFDGALRDAHGNPLTIEGLWALKFGNGGNAGNPNTLYFTAGIPGPGDVEDHGLFGSLAPTPEPSTLLPIGLASMLGLTWLRRRK